MPNSPRLDSCGTEKTKVEDFETESHVRVREECDVGFGCRKHAHPLVSRTLLVPAFYQHYGLDKAFRDEFSSDGHLEFEDSEIYEHFREFYADVRAELASTGGLRQLLVCCNGQAHLRGNVYVEFAGPKEAVRAFLRLHGRWYDGRQLTCRFVDIPSWRAAICGTCPVFLFIYLKKSFLLSSTATVCDIP